jgi:Zn-dependent protease
MRSSFRLFRILGISVEVHITFLLFFLLLLLAGAANSLFFVIIFSVVLAHELCHSVAAILSGIPVPRILLLPFGGLASIEVPEKPMTELKVSLAGPLFNFFLSAVCVFLILVSGFDLIGYGRLLDLLYAGGVEVFTPSYVLSLLATSNFILGVFNMLPAFPMDGGRVFRSVLALWVDYVRATEIAGRVGQLIFAFLIVAGLLTFNIWWIVVGFFLIYASGGEVRFTQLRRAFNGLLMRDMVYSQMMLPVVQSSMAVGDFFSLVARPSQRFYLVVDGVGSLKGILDLHDLEGVGVPTTKVGSFSKGGYGVVDGCVRVMDVLKNVLSNAVTLVVDNGSVIGYVTPEFLMEAAMFRRLSHRA